MKRRRTARSGKNDSTKSSRGSSTAARHVVGSCPCRSRPVSSCAGAPFSRVAFHAEAPSVGAARSSGLVISTVLNCLSMATRPRHSETESIGTAAPNVNGADGPTSIDCGGGLQGRFLDNVPSRVVGMASIFEYACRRAQHHFEIVQVAWKQQPCYIKLYPVFDAWLRNV